MLAEYVTVANPSPAGQKVAVVALMFFVFFYGLFIDAASFIYSSEIYPTNIRSRGMAMATATYFTACIVSCINLAHAIDLVADVCVWLQTYVTPGATAIASIGWRYYLVFMCLTVISIIVIYFFYPETKRRPLEELAEYFGETVIKDAAGHEKSEGSTGGEKNGHSTDFTERVV